jgi:hypothetical protein
MVNIVFNCAKIVSGSKGDFNGISQSRLLPTCFGFLSRMGGCMGCTELPYPLAPSRKLAEGWTSLIAHSTTVTVPFSMRLRFLQQGKDLLPLHTGKTFEKVCNGVTGPKMVIDS